jgi:hypothetical protein
VRAVLSGGGDWRGEYHDNLTEGYVSISRWSICTDNSEGADRFPTLVQGGSQCNGPRDRPRCTPTHQIINIFLAPYLGAQIGKFGSHLVVAVPELKKLWHGTVKIDPTQNFGAPGQRIGDVPCLYSPHSVRSQFYHASVLSYTLFCYFFTYGIFG